jgi:poly(3-hydroxybutyrate) depolymerase
MKNILLTLCLLACCVLSFGQQTAKGLTAANGQYIGFHEFKPYDYNSNSDKHPLIIFLHGTGERGNGTTELNKVTWNAIPKYCANGATMAFTYGGQQFSFLVLSPQLNSQYGVWENFYTEEMIKYAKQNLRVDTNRIYLCGLSLGGGGVWKYATSSVNAAKQLAAIAPVCGTGEGTYFPNLTQNKVAVWAFHAMDDYTVGSGNTTYSINQINNNNPQIIPKATYYPNGGHGIWDRAFDMGHSFQSPFNVYEWMLSFKKDAAAPINLPPVSRAGNDKEIVLPMSTVNVNGANSLDQDGTPVKYQWSQLSGAPGATIATATSATTDISNLSAGTYIFRLTVTDIQGAVSTDDVRVVVYPAGSTNAKPIAIAGDDITHGGDFYVCSSWGSTDPDGSITSYKWNKIEGPAQYSMPDANIPYANVYSLTNGTYQFRLEVKDNLGVMSEDTVQVVISLPGINLAPVANAGADVTTAGTNAVLNASASKDVDGTVTYAWSQLSGPVMATITNSASGITAINNLAPGVYSFSVTVTDNKGVTSTDNVTVTIQGALLPVTYLYFNGERKGSGSLLKWATDNEQDNNYFEIERSQDGNKYTVIGKVDGAGNSSNVQEYIYTDANAPKGKLFYRLKQVDKDGAASFSKVVTLNGDNQKTTEEIYPNPVQDNLNIVVSNEAKGNGRIVLYDLAGRSVWQQSIVKTTDYFKSNISTNKLTPGLYLVELTINDNYKVIQRIVKQ